MTNEQNIQQQTPKKNNGCLIGCGCLLVTMIICILIISGLVFWGLNTAKSMIKSDLDNFFGKYNNQDMKELCQNIISVDSSAVPECITTMDKMYNDLGKVVDYNLSILKGANIKMNSTNGKTEKFVKTTGDFEKVKDVNLEFEMFIDKSGETKVNYFEYKKD